MYRMNTYENPLDTRIDECLMSKVLLQFSESAVPNRSNLILSQSDIENRDLVNDPIKILSRCSFTADTNHTTWRTRIGNFSLKDIGEDFNTVQITSSNKTVIRKC